MKENTKLLIKLIGLFLFKIGIKAKLGVKKIKDTTQTQIVWGYGKQFENEGFRFPVPRKLDEYFKSWNFVFIEFLRNIYQIVFNSILLGLIFYIVWNFVLINDFNIPKVSYLTFFFGYFLLFSFEKIIQKLWENK